MLILALETDGARVTGDYRLARRLTPRNQITKRSGRTFVGLALKARAPRGVRIR
jgi:hypothetical protein